MRNEARDLVGLNKSFLEQVTSVLAADSARDLSFLFKQYSDYYTRYADQLVASNVKSNALGSVSASATPEKPLKKGNAKSAFTFGASSSSSSDAIVSSVGGTTSSTSATTTIAGTTSGTAAAAKPAFSFGSFTPAPTAPTAPVVAEPDAKPAFSFGTPAQTAEHSKPAFSFGSSSAFGATTTAAAPSFSFGSSSTAPASIPGAMFSFGAPLAQPANTVPAQQATTETTQDDDDAPQDEQLGDALMIGKGEEDEETHFQQRAKLFSLVSGEFTMAGLGDLKLNKNKSSQKARLLFRAEGSGRILLNEYVIPNAPITKLSDKRIQFTARDATSGKIIPWMVHLKLPTDCSELYEKLVEAAK